MIFIAESEQISLKSIVCAMFASLADDPETCSPPKLNASNGSWVRRIAIILGSLATKVLSRRHTAIIGFVQVEFEFFRRNGVFDL